MVLHIRNVFWVASRARSEEMRVRPFSTRAARIGVCVFHQCTAWVKNIYTPKIFWQ